MTIEHTIKSKSGVQTVKCSGDKHCVICNPYMPARVGGYWHLRHRYKTIRDTTVYLYQVCMVCGRRRIKRTGVTSLIAVKDLTWLKTGSWRTDVDTGPHLPGEKPRNLREAVDPFGEPDSTNLEEAARELIKHRGTQHEHTREKGPCEHCRRLDDLEAALMRGGEQTINGGDKCQHKD